MQALGDAAQAYAVGLDAQRHSAALHANAALASLRMRCYVQAIAHCDKARSGLRGPLHTPQPALPEAARCGLIRGSVFMSSTCPTRVSLDCRECV